VKGKMQGKVKGEVKGKVKGKVKQLLLFQSHRIITPPPPPPPPPPPAPPPFMEMSSNGAIEQGSLPPLLGFLHILRFGVRDKILLIPSLSLCISVAEYVAECYSLWRYLCSIIQLGVFSPYLRVLIDTDIFHFPSPCRCCLFVYH